MNNISRLSLIICLLLPTVVFAAEEHGHGPSLSGFYWRIFIFAVFLAIMIKLLKNRVKTGLGDGVARIVKVMEDAKRTFDDSEKELAEYSHKIAGMNAELEKMKQTALKSAEKEAEMMVQEAEKAAIKYKELTERNIAAELEKSKSELQKEAVLLALAAAENELSKDSDLNKKQKYIENNIPHIGANQ